MLGNTNQRFTSTRFSSYLPFIMPCCHIPPLFCQLFFFLLVSLLLFPVLFSSSSISATSNNISTSSVTRKAPSSTHPHQNCIHQHLSALLQLKRGFNFSQSFLDLSSWNANDTDCCSWEGITCNNFTGHVIGLDLTFGLIAGVFDFESLFHLRSLRRLGLSDNYFDGSPIPSGFGQLSSLTHLDLSCGNFYGQIPPDMFRLTRLVSLDLSYNEYNNGSNYAYLELESSGMGQVFPNLSSLRELNLDLVNVSALGSQWSKILLYGLPNLRKLSMHNCSLSGPIHPSLSRLHFLAHLDLSLNHISSVSQSRVNLSQLVYLNLSNNNFQGPIPRFIFEQTELIDLDLSSNNFSGVIDLGLFQNFKNLSFLDLSYNSLTDINDAESNSTSTSFSQHLFALTEVDFSHNQFHGDIPSSIGELKSLRLLNLSHNHFQGIIPPSLGNITELDSLDLSQNRLSGEIPRQLTKLLFLVVLNLSQNELTGSIPQDGRFSIYKNDSFVGNPGLCGPPMSRKCEKDAVSPPPTQSDNGSELDFMWIGFGVGHAVGFGIFFWTLVLWRKARHAFFAIVDRVFLSFLIFAKRCGVHACV